MAFGVQLTGTGILTVSLNSRVILCEILTLSYPQFPSLKTWKKRKSCLSGCCGSQMTIMCHSQNCINWMKPSNQSIVLTILWENEGIECKGSNQKTLNSFNSKFHVPIYFFALLEKQPAKKKPSWHILYFDLCNNPKWFLQKITLQLPGEVNFNGWVLMAVQANWKGWSASQPQQKRSRTEIQ